MKNKPVNKKREAPIPYRIPKSHTWMEKKMSTYMKRNKKSKSAVITNALELFFTDYII